MIEHVPSWWPMAGYALGFVMGATTGPRFAFYSKCLRRRPGPYSSHPRGLEVPPPRLGYARWFINNPVQIAECGGPCSIGPSHCDCGALWLDVPRLDPGTVQRGNGSGGPTNPKPRMIPRGTRSISYPDPGPDRQPTNPFTGDPVKPQPHGGRIIREGQWDPGWNYLDMRTGYQPRPHSDTPNPPPTDP